MAVNGVDRCLQLWIGCHLSQGAESYRGGTKTSVRGTVTGKTAKKAIGGVLDTAVGELSSSHGKVPKGSAKAAAKGKAKAKAKTKNLSSPEEKEKKELLKDIKAFFSFD